MIVEPVYLQRPNTVLLMATVPEGMALRGAYTGAFSDVLLNLPPGTDICEVHTKAAHRMTFTDQIGQVPILYQTLTKELRLSDPSKPGQVKHIDMQKHSKHSCGMYGEQHRKF